MLFNSYAFILYYLPLVLSGFYALCRLNLAQLAKYWLFLTSLFFYGYWDHRYLPLLLLSIVFNYLCGKAILLQKSENRRKFLLLLGLIANLSLLFYFKYFNFFISSLGLSSFRLEQIILPLGISFFTFTQIAYLVDAYKNKVEKSDFVSYSLFVTIFPHLIAGPILHHKEMISQFNGKEMFQVSWKNILHGSFLFIIGLFKKVMIADYLATLVKPIFENTPDSILFIQSWFGALSYTLQLYFDFSGYSDMAVGLGLLFSLYLPINFNSPYQADSIIDFWRRWHITLSHFLRDYLYVGLGGNRKGKSAKMRNLLITMILGGLWHGAGKTFILWGACHGLFLIINHLWRETKISLPSWAARTLTLLCVIGSWVIFRSPNIRTAFSILKGMVGLNGFILPEMYQQFISDPYFHLFELSIVGFLLMIVLFMPNSNELTNRCLKKPVAWAFPFACLFMLCFINLDKVTEFLYYQF